MSLIDWSDALELGVDQMDSTHREFVVLLNALAEVPEAKVLAAFDAFYAHTVAHFDQEADWMRTLSFPPIHCHTAEHEGVLEVMREVRGYLAAGDINVGRVLARELAIWFRDHAATMDAMLAYYMKAHGAEPQSEAKAGAATD